MSFVKKKISVLKEKIFGSKRETCIDWRWGNEKKDKC